MKKITKIKHWLLVLIEKHIYTEKPNPKKNEFEIINLLKYSNFTPLNIQQSIIMKQNIDHEFNKYIDQTEKEYKRGLEAIEHYKLNKKDRLMKIIQDPVFEKQLSELEVKFEIVKPKN